MKKAFFWAMGAACALQVRSHAVELVFAVDAANSSITISGNTAGTAFEEQGTGSLTTTYDGFFRIELGASSFQILPDSQIDARVNGTWQPGLGGAAGSAPADYGAKANSLLGPLTGAFRRVVLDVLSIEVPFDSNGGFEASGLVFSFPSNSEAVIDYTSVFSTGSIPLSGLSTNTVATKGSLTSVGASQRLTIPVDSTFFFRTLSPDDSQVTLRGRLVANQVMIPVFSKPVFSNGSMSVRIAGVANEPQLQSSLDLRTWTPKAAQIRRDGNSFLVVIPTVQPREFIRAVAAQ